MMLFQSTLCGFGLFQQLISLLEKLEDIKLPYNLGTFSSPQVSQGLSSMQPWKRNYIYYKNKTWQKKDSNFAGRIILWNGRRATMILVSAYVVKSTFRYFLLVFFIFIATFCKGSFTVVKTLVLIWESFPCKTNQAENQAGFICTSSLVFPHVCCRLLFLCTCIMFLTPPPHHDGCISMHILYT